MIIIAKYWDPVDVVEADIMDSMTEVRSEIVKWKYLSPVLSADDDTPSATMQERRYGGAVTISVSNVPFLSVPTNVGKKLLIMLLETAPATRSTNIHFCNYEQCL